MRSALKPLLIIAAALAIPACGIFGDEDETLEPAELLDFRATVSVQRLWSVDLGGDAEYLRLALQPVGDGNRIYAASHDGDVLALDPETGNVAWRTRLDMALTAGPGVGDGYVVVTSSDGLVVALDTATGNEHWRIDIDGESLARPLITNDLVIVQTVDNRLRAMQTFDGSLRWEVLQETPALTQRGTATPMRVGLNVVAGFDNGYLMAIDLDTGATAWEALLAPPTGRSDLERLSDVDGAMAVVGQDIYAAGYQRALTSVAAESGQILWAADISTYEGVAADWTNLYTVQDDGVIISVTRRNGTEAWRQDALLRREPTLPVPYHGTVVTGDFEGYLHFFSNLAGEPVARVRVDSKAITTDPVVVADRLFVQSDGGRLSAYQIRDPERRDRSNDLAEDEGA